MISKELQKKIDGSVKLLQTIAKGYDKPIEVAYSGGKDSDVILQLTKESGIDYVAYYKNTTIDPPGTIQHVKDMGVEIVRPKQTFFELIATKGYPTRWRRFCCSKLKEYKICDKTIIGVRRDESVRRASRYKEPTGCRYFGRKTEENHVEQIYPILDWTMQDVADYLQDRGIKCAPVYYDEGGVFHPERRLGCLCCPLQSNKKRIQEFLKYPKMLRAYCKANTKYRATHPNCGKNFKDAYEEMYFNLTCKNLEEFKGRHINLFGEEFNAKEILENYFKVKLD